MFRKLIMALKGQIPSPSLSDQTLLGEILVITDRCTRECVDQALELQKTERRPLGDLLKSICRIRESDINEAIQIQTYMRSKEDVSKVIDRLERASRRLTKERALVKNSADQLMQVLEPGNGSRNNNKKSASNLE